MAILVAPVSNLFSDKAKGKSLKTATENSPSLRSASPARRDFRERKGSLRRSRSREGVSKESHVCLGLSFVHLILCRQIGDVIPYLECWLNRMDDVAQETPAFKLITPVHQFLVKSPSADDKTGLLQHLSKRVAVVHSIVLIFL